MDMANSNERNMSIVIKVIIIDIKYTKNVEMRNMNCKQQMGING